MVALLPFLIFSFVFAVVVVVFEVLKEERWKILLRNDRKSSRGRHTSKLESAEIIEVGWEGEKSIAKVNIPVFINASVSSQNALTCVENLVTISHYLSFGSTGTRHCSRRNLTTSW